MRIRILSAVVAVVAALGIIAVPAAVASTGTPAPPTATSIPALAKVPVKGLARNGKAFRGTYGIQSYVVRRGHAYAVGTLTGAIGRRHISRDGVMMPASLTGAGSSAAAAAATSCPILHLVLGPVNLNLLGLHVQLGGGSKAKLPIVLNITAVQGPGNLLGNLLCGLTNALNGTGVLSQLDSQLQGLAATLTSLTSLFGQIPATA